MSKKNQGNKDFEVLTTDSMEDEKTEQPEPIPTPVKQSIFEKHRTVCISAVTALAGFSLAAVIGLGLISCNHTTQMIPITPEETAVTTASAETTASETGLAAHTHDWTMTYKTVHHDAVTHTETVEPVYANKTSYHTVCNDCEQIIDGIADQHIKDTGHSGYSTNVPIVNEVLVSEGYTYEVTDTPAYDETVADEMVCTICGAEQSIAAQSE